MSNYGPPPHRSSFPPGQTQYGAPLQPQGYGGRPSYEPVSGPIIPSAPPAGPKKAPVMLFVGLGAAAIVLAGGVTGVAVWKMRQKPVALPVDAKMLPATTTDVGTQLIEATRETDEHVKEAYLAAELGSEMCRMGRGNPAETIESLPRATTREAKDLFFNKTKIDEIKSLLECGSLLAASLDSPYQAGIVYEEDEKTKRRVAVGHFKMTELPTKYGFTKFSYSGLPGFCRTQEEDKSGKTGFVADKGNECLEKTPGAFQVPNLTTWFLGDRAALEGMAKSVKRPKEELPTKLASLEDAARQTEGLPVMHISASPKSSREFFSAPCWLGASHSAAPMMEFLEGCFPLKQVEKQLDEIDSKIKAAAFETDGDPQKAEAFHGNIVFVARDKEGAKDVEKDVKEIVSDWKTHLDNNEAKLINKSQDNASSARTKKFAAVADTYFKALKKMQVKRDGRTVQITFREPLTSSDKLALEDADKKTVKNRQAVADILLAIQGNKAVPEAPLARLVGAPWAKYLTGPTPAATLPRSPLPKDECTKLQKKIGPYTSSDFTNADVKATFVNHKYASCSVSPPEVDAVQRGCLLVVKTAGDYERCMTPNTAGEPLASDYGEKKK